MSYSADTVFPLMNVYSFAERVGGRIAILISAIREWKDFPDDLSSYGAFSQARRALCYLALQQHGLWEQFVTECWPTANTTSARPIIEELERDFINNGLLAKYRHTLPPEARDMRLPEPAAANRIQSGEGVPGGQLQNRPPEPPQRPKVVPPKISQLRRVLIAAAKTFAVAIISALGAKLGGWIGGVIAATIAGALAVVTPIEPDGGSQEHPA